MSDLAALRGRAALLLGDSSYTRYSTDMIVEALRSALAELNRSAPQTSESVLSLTSAGREVDLSDINGLVEVLDAWWPYESEGWPPNRVSGWRLYWQSGSPVLLLHDGAGGEPQAGESLRLWYAAAHTLEYLDGATSTSLPADWETALVEAAAGGCAVLRGLALIEAEEVDLYQAGLLVAWGRLKLKAWVEFLRVQRERFKRAGAPWGTGWQMD